MTAFVKQLSQQSLNNLSLTWQCTFFVTISRHQIRDLTFTFAHNWGLKNAVYDCCPKDRPPKRAAEKKGQNQVCSHIWWNDTFPRVLRLSEGAGCWQQELLSGMQVSAEHKSESLQPVHSKDKLSPHPAVAHLHGCSANKLPAIASMSVPGIPFCPCCSSAAPTQEFCVWEETPRTPRKSQIERRIPVQYWTALLGPRQDELRDQQPLAASFTKERAKPASQTGFLFSGSKTLCWLTHLIKKLQLTDRTFKNQC